ncbi:hypothetical protein JG687_00016860 [Phytophthora cactorum]|uniref:HTH CENPB-type domain-containing protein n=1 Tax=Phytophthora cactorum TaxID=29920 RepID=A0A8T1TSZ8_9STRA|nr:hypothetical protein JG687_00016860 [Phytophthora cactorum]
MEEEARPHFVHGCDKKRCGRAPPPPSQHSLTIYTFFPDQVEEKYQGRRVLVLKWARNLDNIAATCASIEGKRKKKARAVGSSTILSPSTEQEILRWINDFRAEGVPATALMLRIKALAAAKELGIPDFRASSSWQHRFKRPHRPSMRSRTRQRQVSPAELAKVAAEFSEMVQSKVAELGVSIVYNADQTAAFFEYLPSKTLNGKEEKTVWVRCGGKSKERATVMILGDPKVIHFLLF